MIFKTRQAIPSQEYRELVGTALCVFNSNNAFIVENILHTNSIDYNWYDLTDKESGALKKIVEATIQLNSNKELYQLFSDIVDIRNRLVHSFLITDKDGQARLATKTKVKDGNIQFVITEDYLVDFIKKNEMLCSMLHEYRRDIGVVV